MVYPVQVHDRVIDLVCAGRSFAEAGAAVGVSRGTAANWWAQGGRMELEIAHGCAGGLAGPVPKAVPEAVPGGPMRAGRRRRALSSEDRAVIAAGHRQGLSCAVIGVELDRDASVVWRELRRNRSEDGIYRGAVAHRVAAAARRRPKAFKLVENVGLCREIEAGLDMGWSPRLIALTLAEYGTDDTWRVSHETIYQAVYVQARGALRADVYRQLSLKRPRRVPRRHDRRSASPYREAFKISQRPAEVADRAVPGHWEGDLIVGPASKSAIGTLVERSTRFTILLHLPERHDANTVAEAMIREMGHLPEALRRSITWDRGTELADYTRIQLALDTTLYFADPHSPWQRGTNENTNRLLRHWFPKGSDLSVHSAAYLRQIAATLNDRPRPTLDLQTPAMRMTALLNTAA